MEIVQHIPCSTHRDSANMQLYQRNIPSSPLQPYLDSRPVETKYTLQMSYTQRGGSCVPPSVPLQQTAVYNPSRVYLAGADSAPWAGYAAAIDIETELKGQFGRLSCDSKYTYVPKSSSDLYAVGSSVVVQPSLSQMMGGAQYAVKVPVAGDSSREMGIRLFNNSTRQQRE